MSITTAEYQSAYDAEFRHTVRSLLLRGLDASEAEEVAQAAWTRGWEKRERLREPASVGGWIHTIALNILRSNFRRDRKLEFFPELEFGASPEPIASRIDARRVLIRCGVKDRALLEDLYLWGYTSQETARRHALKPVGVRVRVLRAKQRLRERLGLGSGALREDASALEPTRDLAGGSGEKVREQLWNRRDRMAKVRRPRGVAHV